jgi:transposase-like protein
MYETVHCPDCNLPTRLVSVHRSSEPGMDEVTYHCKACEKQFTRSVRAKTLDGLQRRATNSGTPSPQQDG